MQLRLNTVCVVATRTVGSLPPVTLDMVTVPLVLPVCPNMASHDGVTPSKGSKREGEQ